MIYFPRDKMAKNKLEISAVICSYNRDKFILGALNSLADQSLPKDEYEIVIVNNNSTDSTEVLSLEFMKDHPEFNIKYFVEKNQGLSFARNRGIKEASSEIVFFIDDDGVASKNYLAEAVNFFKNNSNISAAGGKVIPIYETGKEPEWLSKYLWGLVTKVDYGDVPRFFPGNKYPAGCNMVFRKNELIEVGLFNTDLKLRSDDKYIFGKFREHNKKFLYVPELIVHHHIDNSRVQPASVKRISTIVGASERARLKNHGALSNLIKICEYKFKFVAALILAVRFLFMGESSKAEYIIKNRWWTLLGYFKKSY